MTVTTMTKAAPTRRQDRDLIEELRLRVTARQAAQPPKPTLDQVQTIVTDLINGVDLFDTGAKMGMTDQLAGERLVMDVVATFGTWLAHSVGRAEVAHTYAADEVQPGLFPEPQPEGAVVIPAGYEPTGRHRRDVDKALCTIVHYRPEVETIARFVARTYTVRQSRLGFPVVAGVWGFAQRNRLGAIEKVSDDLVFQEQVLEAFDLLDVAREDAVEAVEALLADRDPAPQDVIRACDRAYWLDEPSFAALRSAAENAATDAMILERLEREVQRFTSRVRSNPGRYQPRQVRDLTLGQIRRICTNAGIRVEPENRAEENEIRNTLKEMGFAVDADRLVPEALRCADQGNLDEFWAVMQARKEGDPTWSVQLQELRSS